MGLAGRLGRGFRGQPDPIAEFTQPQSCPRCGRTFASPGALTVGHEPGRCLPDGAYGQLVNVDGVWDHAWRHPQQRPR